MVVENVEKTEYEQEIKAIYDDANINDPWYFTHS
jgi:hypothetical protein